MKQLSFVTHPQLTRDGVAGVGMSPVRIAAALGLVHEQSFDDLDYFEFVGIEMDGIQIGFLRHRGAPPDVSVVITAKRDVDQVREILGRLLQAPWMDSLQY